MKDFLLCIHVVAKTLNFEIWRLSFGRQRQRIMIKWVLSDVWHDYLSSFNQSDSLFSGVAVAVVLDPEVKDDVSNRETII